MKKQFRESKEELKSEEKTNSKQTQKSLDGKENEKELLVFLKKDFKFEDYKNTKKGTEIGNKIKCIRYIEDSTEINGTSFEYDSINYIFKQIYSITSDRNFSIVYDFSPDIKEINIFPKV